MVGVKEKKVSKGQRPKKSSLSPGPLFTYKVLSQGSIHAAGAAPLSVLLDLGFSCFIELTAAQGKNLKPDDIVQSQSKTPDKLSKIGGADKSWLYHYKAYVERVIDGDTFWVRIDLGFRSWIRQKLRLRGLDTPELNTPEGKATKKFVEGQLKGVPWVFLTTEKPDKYDRYLSDIFFERRGRTIHLNQLLLDRGLARVQTAFPPADWDKGG